MLNFDISLHGLARINQRGFNNNILNVLEYFGEYVQAPGNAERIILTKKMKNDIISTIKIIMNKI
jgi:endo-alpha-1,4-polygalactosaminidase (GH114 family)